MLCLLDLSYVYSFLFVLFLVRILLFWFQIVIIIPRIIKTKLQNNKEKSFSHRTVSPSYKTAAIQCSTTNCSHPDHQIQTATFLFKTFSLDPSTHRHLKIARLTFLAKPTCLARSQTNQLQFYLTCTFNCVFSCTSSLLNLYYIHWFEQTCRRPLDQFQFSLRIKSVGGFCILQFEMFVFHVIMCGISKFKSIIVREKIALSNR